MTRVRHFVCISIHLSVCLTITAIRLLNTNRHVIWNKRTLFNSGEMKVTEYLFFSRSKIVAVLCVCFSQLRSNALTDSYEMWNQPSLVKRRGDVWKGSLSFPPGMNYITDYI